MNYNLENIVLSTRNISFGFKQNVYILNDINLSLKRNVITGLVGKSGEGKTVFSRILAGLLPYDQECQLSGQVIYYNENDSIDLLSLSEKEIQKYRGQKISMIFQDPYSSFDPILTCGQQLVETIITNFGIKKNEAKQRAKEYIKKYDLEERILDCYPHQISGGELQRIAIAIAMVSEPEIIIADEPVTNLDAINKKQILDLLLRLKNKHKLSVLYISHDLNSIIYISDEIYSLHDGDLNKTNAIDLIANIKSKQISDKRDNTVKEEVLFSMKGIVKSFVRPGFFNMFSNIDRNLVLENINLHIKKSEIVGIVGESGSGKTTLAKMLVGLESFDKGVYSWFSKVVSMDDAQSVKKLRENIQLVFQNPANSLNPLVKNRVLINEAYWLRTRKFGKDDSKGRIIQLFDELDLGIDILDRFPHQISGGEAQRLAIARILLLLPKVIVFDEALSSLDYITKNATLKKLLQIQKEYNLSYIFITHDIQSIRYICDRIVILKKGEIVEEGNPGEIFKNPHSEYTQKLIDNII